ncbi:MAG: hypothetical protein QHC78_07955 [Pigmentiphaga sp.]|uniref:hypothetical protein n=1 Tax=Pigmentiphaga sp. TaxID=1977564 RepID=UPI0029AB98A2|nr:hypothetical protein [Pigmentiphaga sp.]MDX3905607.1 hypothetical protein [Pigmentiphaga sp.]
MSVPNVVRLGAADKIIIGKPARPTDEKMVARIERGLSGSVSIMEAHLPQYFLLGNMPGPKLLLVLVVQDASTQENVALKANEVLAKGPEAAAIDVFVTDLNDELLPTVRKAQCQLALA